MQQPGLRLQVHLATPSSGYFFVVRDLRQGCGGAEGSLLEQLHMPSPSLTSRRWSTVSSTVSAPVSRCANPSPMLATVSTFSSRIATVNVVPAHRRTEGGLPQSLDCQLEKGDTPHRFGRGTVRLLVGCAGSGRERPSCCAPENFLLRSCRSARLTKVAATMSRSSAAARSSSAQAVSNQS